MLSGVDDEVERFRALLAGRLGWAFGDGDLAQLRRVLNRRADLLKLSPTAYLARLGRWDAHAEVTWLAEDLTITETYFFRHGEQFRALAEEALPERVRARAAQRVLRMLSVGCSSGEEAYTLAIVGRLAVGDPGWIVSVLGVDANPAMVQRAVAARYSSWSLRDTPDDVRERWFRPGAGGYELNAGIRDLVRFRVYNVADDDPALWRTGEYDVILCRNLLMYLTPAASGALIGRMTAALAPGGYLFLGHTDSLGARPDGLEPLHSHRTFYYRRPTSVPAPAPKAPPPRATASAAPAADHREPALALLRQERFAEALAVIEAGPDGRADDLLLRGVLLAQVGRFDEAETAGRRLLDVDAMHADAHHLLGVCCDGGAVVDVAIGHYRLAAYLDPAFAMPRLRLGLLARRRGDDGTAGAELDRAVHLLRDERDERIELFGGGFGRIALTALCQAERDAGRVRR